MVDTVHKLPVKNEKKAPSENGWRPLQSLRHEVDRLFDAFDNWRMPSSDSMFAFAPFGRVMTSLQTPAADIAETEKDYEITAELPGMDEKNVEVSLANGGLVIRGHKEEQKEEKKKDYFLSERQYGTFERYFGIPEGVEADKIAATFKNGVLTVTLPKSAKMQASEKKISVKAA